MHRHQRGGTGRVNAQPPPLQRLPGGFEQQALLRIHRLRLARTYGEEGRVELTSVSEEAALSGVAGTDVFGVGVVEVLDIPAPVGGELGDAVAAFSDEIPQILGGADPSWIAASHADDRDRLVSTVLQVLYLLMGPAPVNRDLLRVTA